MFEFLKNLFGGKNVDYQDLLKRGAQIVDVRTPAEYKSGHIFNAKNIPLQQLQTEMGKLDPKRPVITCCASGARSASAKMLLNSKGFEAYNGGGWQSLEQKLKK